MIETERFYFKSYEERDFDFLYSLLSDPKMVQYIGNGQTRDREGAKRFYNRMQKIYEEDPRLGIKILFNKENHHPIGHAGIVPQLVESVRELEIGYWMAPQFWGQGFATEAALALREYGETSLGAPRLISLIQKGNKASQRVAFKTGLRFEKEIILAGKSVLVYATQSQAW